MSFLKSIQRKAAKAAEAARDAAKVAKGSLEGVAAQAGDVITEKKTNLEKRLDKDVFDAYLSGCMLLLSANGDVSSDYSNVKIGLKGEFLSKYNDEDVDQGMAVRLDKLVRNPTKARSGFYDDLCDVSSDEETANLVLDAITVCVYDGSDAMGGELDTVTEALGFTEKNDTP